MKARMWGVSQVSVNTSVMLLSGVGGIAAIHSEWHCSLIHTGLMVPQASQPFAIFGSLLPEVQSRYKSHQPRSYFWKYVCLTHSVWYEWLFFFGAVDLPSFLLKETCSELSWALAVLYVCNLQVMFTSMGVREWLSQSFLNLLLSSEWLSRKNKALFCSCPPSTNGVWFSSPVCF